MKFVDVLGDFYETIDVILGDIHKIISFLSLTPVPSAGATGQAPVPSAGPTPVEHPGREPGSTGQAGQACSDKNSHRFSEEMSKRVKARVVGGSVADDLFDRGLCLPSGTAMTNSDLDRVIDTILKKIN